MLKLISIISLVSLLFYTTGCKRGFFSPRSMELEVPEGPPAYKAGWYDGCRTALSVKKHANSYVYDVTMGNGVYQHDKLYQSAWSNGWFSCYISSGSTTKFAPFVQYPAK